MMILDKISLRNMSSMNKFYSPNGELRSSWLSLARGAGDSCPLQNIENSSKITG